MSTSEAKLNPKHIRAMKDGKAPLEYLVTSVFEGDAWVHKGGADKYGRNNWQIDEILATTYVASLMRHVKAWAEGEDTDPDSGWSHLYHVRAGAAIVLDAGFHGKLIDDRGRAESIDQTKTSAEMTPPVANTGPLCIVVYTDTQPNADKVMLTRTKSFGPFDCYADAKEFIDATQGQIPGKVSFSTLIPVQEIEENVRDRNQEVDRSSDGADEFTSVANRTETITGGFGRPDPSVGFEEAAGSRSK